MKNYSSKISLTKTDRGVWGLDPFKGCPNGSNGGCYGVCYAARLSVARGFDYSKVVTRDFLNYQHLKEIRTKLIRCEFVRLGVMCDPSYNWDHTLQIIDKIKPFNQNIVIITRHFTDLKKEQLEKLNGLVINTSISALDDKKHRDKMMYWYNELKKHCKSVLRVNTVNFIDKKLNSIQDDLLNNDNVIDNILRIPKGHSLVINSIIEVKKYNYLKSNIYASKHDDNIFFGYCDECMDKCGAEIKQTKLGKFI